jgi:hypothetical protein
MTPADHLLTQSVTNSLVTAGLPAQTLNNVHVRSMNGRVTLTGQVNNPTEKQQIETQVRQIPGVRMVDNRLQVGAGTDATGTGGPGAGAGASGTGTGTANPGANPTAPGNPGAGTTSGTSDTSGANPGPR